MHYLKNKKTGRLPHGNDTVPDKNIDWESRCKHKLLKGMIFQWRVVHW